MLDTLFTCVYSIIGCTYRLSTRTGTLVYSAPLPAATLYEEPASPVEYAKVLSLSGLAGGSSLLGCALTKCFPSDSRIHLTWKMKYPSDGDQH